jgi:hypothetical protein
LYGITWAITIQNILEGGKKKMKNLANCRSLIRVAVIMVVVAFMVSQMTDAYAKENQGNPRIIDNLQQHDTDIKAEISTNNDNMMEQHGVLDTKLDEISAAVQNGENGACPTCCDAWSKQLLADDRWVLVLGIAVDIGGEFPLWVPQAALDKETCLVWDKNPSQAAGTTWNSALIECFKSEVGGRGGWRLPTIEELATLKDTENDPALPTGIPINIQQNCYWSQTTDVSLQSPPGAWFVDFSNGLVDVTGKNGSCKVLCV